MVEVICRLVEVIERGRIRSNGTHIDVTILLQPSDVAPSSTEGFLICFKFPFPG